MGFLPEEIVALVLRRLARILSDLLIEEIMDSGGKICRYRLKRCPKILQDLLVEEIILKIKNWK